MDQGLAFATDALSEAILLRQLASGQFVAGDIDGGRAAYMQAVRVFEKYPESNAVFVATTQGYTEAFWAGSELGQRNCTEAWEHLRAAETIVAAMHELAPAKIEVVAARTRVQQTCGQQPS